MGRRRNRKGRKSNRWSKEAGEQKKKLEEKNCLFQNLLSVFSVFRTFASYIYQHNYFVTQIR